MTSVVAIDLGKSTSGVALFRDGVLCSAFEVKVASGHPRHMALRLWTRGRDFAPTGAIWVAEKMVDYRGKGARRRALQGLRDVAESLQDCLDRSTARHTLKLYRASEWKGGTTKRICHFRTLRALQFEERSCIVVSTKETLDAIGIGLFETGRLGRGMTRRNR